METHAVARKLTRRFVAGETLEDGLEVCASLAAEGIHTTLDHLGENVALPGSVPSLTRHR